MINLHNFYLQDYYARPAHFPSFSYVEPETLSAVSNFETDDDDDDVEIDEKTRKLLWDRRYDRQTLSIRRRDKHVSPRKSRINF